MKNPPAFPRPATYDKATGDAERSNGIISPSQEGMTLRDYFAAKAMQGMCSSDEYAAAHYDKIAEWAYAQADAMLKAREK